MMPRTLTALAMLLIPAPAGAQDTTQTLIDDLPPAGFGTLRQEDISLRLQLDDIRLSALPLDERVIRLLSPDSYDALRDLKALKISEIEESAAAYGVRNPTLFVVTFFGMRERAQFSPEDVTVTSRGRFFRPIAIVPLTPRWSEQHLAQRETAVAVYAFEPGIEVLERFEFSYATARTSIWDRVLPTLDQERAAVIARAAAAGKS